MRPEVPDCPERDARGKDALNQSARGGLPVPATFEAILGSRPAVEEPSSQQHSRECKRGDATGKAAAALELRRERLQPSHRR